MARIKYKQVARDSLGNVSVGTDIEVRKDSDNSLVTMYAASTGATTKSNPTTTDANGAFEFWIEDSDQGLFNITVGSGASEETFPVVIGANIALPTALDFQGGWDASGGSFPTSTTAGEYWTVETAGTVDSVSFAVGDDLIAIVDSASTSTYSANWFKKVGGTVTQSDLDLKAPLASPAFTGAPTAPTAAAGTETTQLATTAFVQAAHDAYLEPLPTNRLPRDLDYSDDLDLRSGSTIADVPSGDLTERGYTKAVKWRVGSDYARWSSGADQHGNYLFGAYLVYSANASNLTMTGATVYSEASGGSLTGLAGQTAGQVVISSTCKLVWITGQVNNSGDENILLGSAIAPADGTRYATGFTLYTGSTAFDGVAMARAMLLRDLGRQDAKTRAAALVDALSETIVDYVVYENEFERGDYFGVAPDLRSASPTVSLPQGALRDLGFRSGIDFGDKVPTSNFWRWETGADQNGKYVFAAFLFWSSDGLESPFTPTPYSETSGGSLTVWADRTTGSVDLGDDVHIIWAHGQVNNSGDENLLMGGVASPSGVYCTNVAFVTSDTAIDTTRALAAYQYRLAVMKDASRRIGESTVAGGATLVLNGTGNVASYVESSLSGNTIKRTFVPFPDTSLTSTPVLFNFGEDYVNGTAVRTSVSDDIAPDHLFGATIGANHGYRLGSLTATAHGKVQADQGSVWETGGTQYVLVKVSDSDTLLMTQRSGNSAPPTGTYTHVSGATNTGDITVTAQSYVQWYPPFMNRTISLYVDGEKITDTTGDFSYQNHVQFVETYDILEKSEMVTWWEANGSSGDIETSGTPSVRITNTYEYDRDGQLTLYRDWLFLQSCTVNDLMGIQAARASGTTHYYIPNTVSFTHDGDTVNYSLIEAADRTSTGGQVSVHFTATENEATGPYVDRVLSLFGSDYVFAQGFLPLGDVSDVAARKTLCSDRALEIRGSSDKLYFRVVDKGDFTASVGEHYSCIAYRHILPRPTARTAAYAVRTQGPDFLYVDWHDTALVDRVAVPPDYAGRSFTVVASKNATVYGDFLAGEVNVDVSASGSYAFAVLQVS